MKLDRAKLKLLRHQIPALDLCDVYLNGKPTRSALVQMPTGTGKTGVMAVVAVERSASAPVLVVCPSDALVDQLSLQFREQFWETVEAEADWRPDKVERLLPSNASNVLTLLKGRSNERIIIVATIAAVQQIHGTPHYAGFVGAFACVLFDEGHREPAVKWAEAVRGLKVPTILFSATPFRNDLKLFDVGDDIHFLSFENAVSRRLVRGVLVEEDLLPLDQRGFARWAVARMDQLIADGDVSANARMIIRTAREEDVVGLAKAFRVALGSRSDGVLAVHHRLKDERKGQAYLTSSVPADLRVRTERFFIHQFMLTEGIDDPRCQVLAFHRPFSSERQLVQQVGRIIRNPHSGAPATPARVFGRTGEGVAEMWGRFLAFDQMCVRNGNRPPLRNDESVFQALVAALPEMDYVDGRFRQRIDLGGTPLEKELLVPCSAVVFEAPHGFNTDVFNAAIGKVLEDEDRWPVASAAIGKGSGVVRVTMRLNQSPFLARTLFQTASLEVTIFVRCGRWLFFYDSGGLWVDENAQKIRRITPDRLVSLLPEADGNVVTAMHLKNTDIGPVSIRTRSISARSLATAGIFMGEHLNVVTRAVGRRGNTRSAIGLSRGRVREREGTYVTSGEFIEWARDIAKAIDQAAPAAAIFGRYAVSVGPPAAFKPVNILVDLEDFRGEFLNAEGLVTEFDLDEVCVSIDERNDGAAGFPYSFEMTVDGAKISIALRWDSERRKFWLRSEELAEHKLKDNERVSLLRRLNQRQPFRIVLDVPDIHYAYGSFYRVDLDLRPTSRAGLTLLGLVRSAPQMVATTSEKGVPTGRPNSWPPGSLFRFVDDELKASASAVFGERYETVVCDDIGDEMADFIGIDAPGIAEPRITFFAAKWKRGAPGVSASLVYDVLAQATKNLAYLKADATALAGASGKWNRNWELGSAAIPRRRSGLSDGPARKAFAQVRSNPMGKRRLSVVLGGGILSRRALIAELGKRRIEPHVLQFYHLIMSVFSACQSVGVELEIICAE